MGFIVTVLRMSVGAVWPMTAGVTRLGRGFNCELELVAVGILAGIVDDDEGGVVEEVC